MHIGASKKEEVFLKKLQVFHFQAMYQRLLHVYYNLSTRATVALNKHAASRSSTHSFAKRQLINNTNNYLIRLLGLLRQEHRVDVRENTTSGNRHRAQQLGQLLVVANGQLNVARHDARLLVVAARVTGQFKHFSAQVFEHGGQVHRRAGTDAGGVLALLQVARDTAHRELEARLGGSARGLLASLSFTSARHVSLFLFCSVSAYGSYGLGSSCVEE